MTEAEIGGLVARRTTVGEAPGGILPSGPTHRIESTIAGRVVTRCGRQMDAHDAHGRGLRLWPQGVRQNPTCFPCSR